MIREPGTKAKKCFFGWVSIMTLAVAAAPWLLLIDGVAPTLVNAASGYAGMFISIAVWAWSILVCGAGIVCGLISLVRREPRQWVAIVGTILNTYALHLLQR